MNMRRTVPGLGLMLVFGCNHQPSPGGADENGRMFGAPDASDRAVGSTGTSDVNGTGVPTTPPPGSPGAPSAGRGGTTDIDTYTPMVDPTASNPRPVDRLVASINGTPDHPEIRGTVTFRRVGDNVEVQTDIQNLPAGDHGYHVHVFGDCSNPAADSAGPHLDFKALSTSASMGTGGMGSTNMGSGTTSSSSGTPGYSSSTPGAPASDRPGTSTTGTSAGTSASGEPMGSTGTTAPGSTGPAPTGSSGRTGGTTTGATPGGPGSGHTGSAVPPTGTSSAGMPDSRITGNLGDLNAIKGKAAQASTTLVLPASSLGMLNGRAVVIHSAANDPKSPDGGAGSPIACGVIGVANEMTPIPSRPGMDQTPPIHSSPGDPNDPGEPMQK